MNKLLLAGGGILFIAGGLAYWYLSQMGGGGQPPQPPPQHGCVGECFYKGSTACDRDDNLCICNNGEWNLLEAQSYKCTSGELHNECFPSMNDIITCIMIPGTGADTCTNLGYSEGCPCIGAECDVFHYCEQRNLTCIQLAQNYLVEGAGNNTHWLNIPIDPVAATTLISGRIWYKWAGIIDVINWSVWGRYEGMDTLLVDGWYSSSGEEGWFDVPVTVFPSQGIDMIRINCNSAFSNVVPDYFTGKLNW